MKSTKLDEKCRELIASTSEELCNFLKNYLKKKYSPEELREIVGNNFFDVILIVHLTSLGASLDMAIGSKTNSVKLITDMLSQIYFHLKCGLSDDEPGEVTL